MFRRMFLATLLTAAASLAASESASGAIISARNPYRSFNISGINYGSMQWELRPPRRPRYRPSRRVVVPPAVARRRQTWPKAFRHRGIAKANRRPAIRLGATRGASSTIIGSV